MNVYNNFIVNNISTHEGGGIALNDAPNVRVSQQHDHEEPDHGHRDHQHWRRRHRPGLSTSLNSALLRPRCRAARRSSATRCCSTTSSGTTGRARGRQPVTGLGTAVTRRRSTTGTWAWPTAPGLLAPTNSIVQQNAGTHPYTTSPTNSAADPAVVAPYDVAVTFNAWRNNPAFLGAIMIAADLPPNLMGNYHITGTGRPAFNLRRGRTRRWGRTPPTTDIDNQAARRSAASTPARTKSRRVPTRTLSITKTDGVTSVTPGQAARPTPSRSPTPAPTPSPVPR